MLFGSALTAARLSSRETGKALIFTPVRASSGECRLHCRSRQRTSRRWRWRGRRDSKADLRSGDPDLGHIRLLERKADAS